MNTESSDFYDELTERDKQLIEIAKKQVEQGLVHSNEEVMAELGKRYRNQG